MNQQLSVADDLGTRFGELLTGGDLRYPLPGGGETSARHRKLAELARRDLPLARLVEAHIDATAILAEAGKRPFDALYAVWAAETTHLPMKIEGGRLSGEKMFCTGAGIVDRALVTVGPTLLDVDLREYSKLISIDTTSWKTAAFAETRTATVTFREVPVRSGDVVGEQNWYIERPGFWHGACGPAACWAGGAMGLYDYCEAQPRSDEHTLAHLAAMNANVWAFWSYLESAGREIDEMPANRERAVIRALTVRHLIEQGAADILRRMGRAYGPRALAFDDVVSKRYLEVELYIRQCHAERDLEALGRALRRG